MGTDPGKLKRHATTGQLERATDGTLKKCNCCDGACNCQEDPSCTSGVVNEYRIEWDHPVDNTATTTYERSAGCCNDLSTVQINWWMQAYIAEADQHCLQLWTGTGTLASWTLRYQQWYNGALIDDHTEEFGTDHCDLPDGYGFLSFQFGGGCVLVSPIIASDSRGAAIHTTNEDRGWAIVSSDMGVRVDSFAWDITLTRDPADTCLEGCGACCHPAGFCIDTDASGCAAVGGEFHDGVHCGDPSIDCHPGPTGACCITDASFCQTCEVITHAECDTAGGIYYGDDSDCPACGPVGTGACCFPDAPCVDGMTACNCAGDGGTYQGDGVECASAHCDPEKGACCIEATGTCVDDLTHAECDADSGVWAGAMTTCNLVNCPRGACCTPDGSCVFTSAFACTATYFGYYQGDGSVCEDQDCLGCCCKDGVGTHESKSDCDDDGGTWFGPNKSCVVTPDHSSNQIDCSTVVIGGESPSRAARPPTRGSGAFR